MNLGLTRCVDLLHACICCETRLMTYGANISPGALHNPRNPASLAVSSGELRNDRALILVNHTSCLPNYPSHMEAWIYQDIR